MSALEQLKAYVTEAAWTDYETSVEEYLGRAVIDWWEEPGDRRALFTGCGEMDPAEMLWQLMECEAVLLGAGFTVERVGDELRVTA